MDKLTPFGEYILYKLQNADPKFTKEELADYLAKDLELKLGKNQAFERVRRITGYLTGDTTGWNNAKQQELADRVTHN